MRISNIETRNEAKIQIAEIKKFYLGELDFEYWRWFQNSCFGFMTLLFLRSQRALRWTWKTEENMKEVVIVSAARTAVGTFGGTLKDIPAVELGKIAVEEALKRAKIKPEQI